MLSRIDDSKDGFGFGTDARVLEGGGCLAAAVGLGGPGMLSLGTYSGQMTFPFSSTGKFSGIREPGVGEGASETYSGDGRALD
jgi:hypothetical protein